MAVLIGAFPRLPGILVVLSRTHKINHSEDLELPGTKSVLT